MDNLIAHLLWYFFLHKAYQINRSPLYFMYNGIPIKRPHYRY